MFSELKKKISILTLLLIFFVSSTSLPVAVYYCNMTHTYSFDKCVMDMPSNGQNNTECEPVRINDGSETSFNDNCCTVKTFDSQIKDSFLVNHTDDGSVVNLIAVIPFSVLSSSSNILLVPAARVDFNSSPPIHRDNPIYLTNSILLI